MPAFECLCCGLCCKRDPFYAVSLLDIEAIARGLGMGPGEFFGRYCAAVDTPGGFRYPAILAPDGCPFLRDRLCGIHAFKPIGCRVFPESSLLPVRLLKRSVRAIESCAILALPDSGEPLEADFGLLARRDVSFEHTRAYFEACRDFDEPSWAVAKAGLERALSDAGAMEKRAAAIREEARRAAAGASGPG